MKNEIYKKCDRCNEDKLLNSDNYTLLLHSDPSEPAATKARICIQCRLQIDPKNPFCYECKQHKPLIEFTNSKFKTGVCRSCESILIRLKRLNIKDPALLPPKKPYNNEWVNLSEEQRQQRIDSKTKECNKCKKSKDKEHFYKQWQNIDGYRMMCKQCELENKRKRNQNPERKKKNSKYMMEYIKKNIQAKIAQNVRIRIGSFLKKRGIHYSESLSKLVGCSREELISHIESTFKPGMTWENYGMHGWHVDHIKPLAKFNLNTEKEREKACHYTNLQALWAEENIAKKDKFTEPSLC